MMEIDHIKYMERALELAAMPGGKTRPNPLVGCVIVNDGVIIGEGYHALAGQPHAEINAIESVRDKGLLKSSTIYVTLEPCSHQGRTPPCARRIIIERIPEVVIAAKDTSSKVAGRGIEMLKKAGLRVITGVLEEKSRDLNKRFFTFHEKNRPWILLKWAESSDGYIDRIREPDSSRGPTWISGMEERILVHKWRSEEHSILVGDNTVIADDPGLDVRYWTGINPHRLVLSERADLDTDLKIFSGDPPAIIFTTNKEADYQNAEVIHLPESAMAISMIIKEMIKREKQSILVEGGAKVLLQFIEKGLWDEARIFRGKKQFGSGLKAPAIDGRKISEQDFEHSRLEHWLPEQ